MRTGRPLTWAIALMGLVGSCSFGLTAEAGAAPRPPVIKAASAILVDAITGQVLYARNADVPRPPASTTKIMTAILLLESLRPDEIITASPSAAATEGSSLHLKPGESITAHDLLYALMLRSANDGCVAVAERIGGSEPQFAAMMTAKAREIGAAHTTFRNCNGLNEPPNVTTARDLATMARYAARYPEFNEATRTRTYKVTRSLDSRDVLLRNHARLLWKFPGADGVKTGYTVPAGHCFVGAATWKGWRLISVVMRSPNTVAETSALLKYGFTRFEPVQAAAAGEVYASVPVRGGQEPDVKAALRDPAQVVVAKGQRPSLTLRPRVSPIEAPVAVGQVIGALEVYDRERLVTSAPLVATGPVARSVAGGPGGRGGWYVFAALLGAVVFRYGSTAAKGARRRGPGFSAGLRNTDRRG